MALPFVLATTSVANNSNIFEKLLIILEFTHFNKRQTARKRYKNKEVINEYTVSVAVNMAGFGYLSRMKNVSCASIQNQKHSL